MSEQALRLTVPDLIGMKGSGSRIVALTAYDAAFATIMDRAGVDLVLVGDSLGMVVQGRRNTLSVTLEEVLYHATLVSRGLNRAALAVDLPFLSYTNVHQALDAAGKIVRASDACLIKLEGGRERKEVVEALSRENIPVCAHLGLLPQSVHRLGGFWMQGKDPSAAQKLVDDAKMLEQAGASVLFLECIPSLLAEKITSSVRIPTIGIGAGPGCDGQILVSYDMLGLSDHMPKFCKDFLKGQPQGIEGALRDYVAAVRTGNFPAESNGHN